LTTFERGESCPAAVASASSCPQNSELLQYLDDDDDVCFHEFQKLIFLFCSMGMDSMLAIPSDNGLREH
jgi:hypothetical protein